MNKTAAKLLLILIKYLPVVTTLVLVIHLFLTSNGIPDPILDNLVRVTPCRALLMIVASYAFKFCFVHRLFTVYNFLISLDMTYHEEFNLGESLQDHRIFWLWAGIFLLGFLCVYRKGFLKCCGAYDNLQ